MEFVESKREINNILFRNYKSNENNEKEKYLNQLIDYNFDFIDYIIKKDFPYLTINKSIYDVGLFGLILGIKTYEMDKIGSFEEFIMSNIKDEIIKYLENKNNLIIPNKIMTKKYIQVKTNK